MSTWELKAQMREEIERACAPIRQAIEERYAPLIAEEQRKEKEAEKKIADKRYREALKKAAYPVGTKLYEWTTRDGNGWMAPRTTGRVGLFEIWHKGSAPVDKKYISPGDTFIRLLKKDGTPGKKIEKLESWNIERWLPEGKKYGEQE